MRVQWCSERAARVLPYGLCYEQWGTRGAARPAPGRWTRFSPMAYLHVQLHRCGAHEALERRNVLYVDWAHVDRLS